MIWVEVCLTSGLFWLQRKHLAYEYFLIPPPRGGVASASPKPKLEDHPLSSVCNCLFNLFTATSHLRGRSSIHNLRKRHAMVTGAHKQVQILPQNLNIIRLKPKQCLSKFDDMPSAANFIAQGIHLQQKLFEKNKSRKWKLEGKINKIKIAN